MLFTYSINIKLVLVFLLMPVCAAIADDTAIQATLEKIKSTASKNKADMEKARIEGKEEEWLRQNIEDDKQKEEEMKKRLSELTIQGLLEELKKSNQNSSQHLVELYNKPKAKPDPSMAFLLPNEYQSYYLGLSIDDFLKLHPESTEILKSYPLGKAMGVLIPRIVCQKGKTESFPWNNVTYTFYKEALVYIKFFVKGFTFFQQENFIKVYLKKLGTPNSFMINDKGEDNEIGLFWSKTDKYQVLVVSEQPKAKNETTKNQYSISLIIIAPDYHDVNYPPIYIIPFENQFKPEEFESIFPNVEWNR